MAYLLMVLLEVCQLLIQGLYLHLQVSPGQSQFIQDPAETINVGLDTLAKCHFILKSKKKLDTELFLLNKRHRIK